MLAVISARYPYAKPEAFLGPELTEVGRYMTVVVAPAIAGRTVYHASPAPVIAAPLLAVATFRDAAMTIARSPLRCAATVSALLTTGTWRHRAKNLAVLPTALALARRFRRADVAHVHGYWLSTAATIAYVIARVNNIAYSATAHRFDIYDDNAIALKAQRAQFVRAISERGANDLRARVRPSDRQKVHLIRVGVRVPDRAAPRRHVRDTLRVLCAAELLPVKGHAVLVEAVALATASGIDIHCDLAGAGPLAAEIAQRISDAGLNERVRLRGNVPHPDLLDELHAGVYDAAILTSIASGTLQEGVPVALMEAMAAGVPCIATDSGGVRELVDNGCGALVPPHNAQAVAAALVAFARDPGARARMGDAARARVLRSFDVSQTMAAFAVALHGAGTSAAEPPR